MTNLFCMRWLLSDLSALFLGFSLLLNSIFTTHKTCASKTEEEKKSLKPTDESICLDHIYIFTTSVLNNCTFYDTKGATTSIN